MSLVSLKICYKRFIPWLASEHWWKLRHRAIIWFGRTLQAMAEPWTPTKSPPVPLSMPASFACGAQGFNDVCSNSVPLFLPLNHMLNSAEIFQSLWRAWRGPLCASPGKCLERLAHTATTLTKPSMEPLSAPLAIAIFKGIILLSPLFSFVSLPPQTGQYFTPNETGCRFQSSTFASSVCDFAIFVLLNALCRRMMNGCRAK